MGQIKNWKFIQEDSYDNSHLFEGLFEEDRFQNGVQLFSDVL